MKKLHIPQGKQSLYFEPEEIICFEGVSRFTNVYVADTNQPTGWKKYTVCRTLKYYEQKMREFNFQRVSKQMVVSLKNIKGYTSQTGLQLNCPCVKYIPVGRKYLKTLKQRIALNLFLFNLLDRLV